MAEPIGPLRSLAGRCDLLRILHGLGEEALESLAPKLGYERNPTEQNQQKPSAELPAGVRIKPKTLSVPKDIPFAPRVGRYWVVTKREIRAAAQSAITPPRLVPHG